MQALLLLALTIGQPTPDYDADARAALALAQAQAKKPAQDLEAVPLTYVEGRKQSLASGKDLWIYVGCPSKPNPTAVVCETESLAGYPSKCIVLGRPENGELLWTSTMDEAGRVLQEKAVQPAADPFDTRFQRPARTAPREGVAVGAGSAVGFHAGHQCPTCGASQFVVSGRGPGGTHAHTCSRDGTTWFH